MPVPPRPPAPLPCFFPRPWVRLPRNFRVLETIVPLLDEQAHEERIDRSSAVPEVAADVESPLDSAIACPRRRSPEDGAQRAPVRAARLASRYRPAQIR